MKAWRNEAARKAKIAAVKEGNHEFGQRYGRMLRMLAAATRIKAMPPMLFIALAYRAGHIQPVLQGL